MSKNMSLSTDERRAFNHLYAQADREELGVLTGDKALPFFEGTQLPGHALGEIWQLSDKEDTGFLTKEAFYVACRLIGHAQNGQTPSESLIDKPGPLPWFKGITIPGLAKQPSPPSGSLGSSTNRGAAPGTPTRQSTASPAPVSSPAPSRSGFSGAGNSSSGLTITPEDKTKYTRLFFNAGPVAGLLDGDKASEILKKSRLPDEKLGQIWNLADTQSRGALDAGDFVIAMALIQATMNGALPALPDSLPDSAYAQSGAYKPGMAPAQALSTMPGIGGAAAPGSPLRAQYTGNNKQGSVPSPMYPQNTGGATGNMMPPARSSTLGASQNAGQMPWAVTPLEKGQSDTFFAMLDSARTGTLTGDIAGPFFMQSGLSGDVLASIWDLSDIKNDGALDKDEFALARRLVMDTLAGKQVPTALEESFVPPALRNTWRGTGQQQQPQQSEVQKDLFSLMDDEEPADSLPAPVAQAGASAFTSQQPPSMPQQSSRVASPAPLQPTPTGGSARGQPGLSGLSAAPIVPTPTGGSARSANVRSPPPPVPAVKSPLAASPAPRAGGNDFFGGSARAGEEEDSDDDDYAGPEILDKQAEVGNLKNQVSQTQRSVSTLRTDRTKMAAEVKKIEAEIEELKSSLSDAKAAYDVESTNMSNLEARQSKGAEELKKLKEETIRTQSDVSGLKEQKRELEQSILKDKEELREFRTRMKATNDEVSALKDELEKLKKEARQQKGMVVVNKKQLATSETERERLQNSIAEERSAPRSEMDDTPSLPRSHIEDAKALPLPASNRASPAASVTSTRSNNPFDRMGAGAFAAAGAGAAAGLAVPAAMHAARSPSPLHDAFTVQPQAQEQQVDHDPFGQSNAQEQDPFGMSTSASSLPPQQASSADFGFDDDFSNSFGAPATTGQQNKEPVSMAVGVLRGDNAQPSSDFDDAFADFDKPSAPAPQSSFANAGEASGFDEPPVPIAHAAPGSNQPENAPVRAASPTTAELSVLANQPEPELPLEQERAASPTATAPFISAAPAGEPVGPGFADGTEGPIDQELQRSISPPGADAPYESRSMPEYSDNDGENEGDLAPIRDMEQADSDSDSDSDEEARAAPAAVASSEPVHDLASSSQATYIDPSHGKDDDIYEPPSALDKGKGRAEDPVPGAYPSDDEDSFEDAQASVPDRSASPTVSPTTDSAAPALPPLGASQTGPSLGFDDAFDSPFNSMTPASGNGATSARAASPSQDAAGYVEQTPAATEQNAPSAAFAETGATIAREAEMPRSHVGHSAQDDFDDFEDLAPARIEQAENNGGAAAPISATSGSFEDSFDDFNNYDEPQAFSHTITAGGVGRATDPEGPASVVSPAAAPSGGNYGAAQERGFDSSFDDAFNIPNVPGEPVMRVVSPPIQKPQVSRPSVGFDDDFFSTPSPSTGTAPRQVSTPEAAPALPSRAQAPQEDDSYMYAPPPGSPPRPQAASLPPAVPPPPQQQNSLQAPPVPARRESDGDMPQVKELRDMGFERNQAIAALEDNQFDVARAANALLAVNN